MSRLNATLIICSALFFCCLDIGAAKSAKVINEWSADHYTSLNRTRIVKVKDEILVVDIPANDTISLRSIDSVKVNTCNFSTPSNSQYTLPLLDAVALGNGKIVVHNLMQTNSFGNYDLYIIVDPWNCSSIKTIVIQTYHNIEDRAVVPYYDTFDLFYENKTGRYFYENRTSTEVYGACRFPLHLRYNDQGESISLKHQLGAETTTSSFRIRTIKPYDASEGYISTMASKNGRMVMLKRLDSNFQVVKESIMGSYAYSRVTGRIEHGTQYHSVASMTNDSISICFRDYETYLVTVTPHCTKEHDKKSTFCEFFDGKDFSRRALVQLYETDDDIDIDVVNLSNGGAVVARAHYPASGAEYYLHRVYSNGTMAEAVRVDFPGKSSLMKMVPWKGSEVCLVAKSPIDPSATTEMNYNLNIITKCIDVFSI